MVTINGENIDAAGKTITEYLSCADYDIKRIVVERNGCIVPKAQYGETVLLDGDSVEVYMCGDVVSDVNDNIGLVSSRVMLCAAHQAHTVVRILANKLDI